jgi:MinD-like ATPase involved in chromosome partitioning or flagellar assembly
MTTLGVFSVRADGATTVAIGLAAVLAARARTLLVDLNLDNPEVADFLDIDPQTGIWTLAHNAQLAPVGREDLEAAIGWRDGIAVLPGIVRRVEPDLISDHFLTGLLEAAGREFEHIVVDLGRVLVQPPAPLASGRLLWVATPTPLGTQALERRYWQLEDGGEEWLRRTSLVLNRASPQSFVGVERYAQSEYGLVTAGVIPETVEFWRGVEIHHSPQALNMSAALTQDARYPKLHGAEALSVRQAFEALADQVTAAPAELATAARA